VAELVGQATGASSEFASNRALRAGIGVLVRGIWILEGLARVLVHPYEFRGLVLGSLVNTDIIILNVHILQRITEVTRFLLLMTAVAALSV
jgi:hypothetical protein